MSPTLKIVLFGVGAIATYAVWWKMRARLGRIRLEANFRKKILDVNPDWRLVGIAMTHGVLTIEQATNIVLQIRAADVDYEREVEPTLIEALKKTGQLPADYEVPEEELREREERRRASKHF